MELVEVVAPLALAEAVGLAEALARAEVAVHLVLAEVVE